MRTMRTLPRNAEELRQMSPAQWTAFKAGIVHNAHLARNAAIHQAFADACEFLGRVGRAITDIAKTSFRPGAKQNDHV